jgi:hypothetical protein
MTKKASTDGIHWQRWVMGLLALGCLVVGGAMWVSGGGSAAGLHGILIRLGCVLAAIWLAMPQLNKLSRAQSIAAFLIVLALAVVAASRPNLFRILALILFVGLAVNWGLRWISRLTGTKR